MKVKQSITLPHDDLEWYFKEHPDISLSAILTLLLHSYRTISTDVAVTPRKVAWDSAKDVRDMIREGILEEKKGS